MKTTPAAIFLPLLLGFSSVAQAFDPARFEKETLVPACRDAVQLEVLANGDVVFAEFWGTVKRWNASTRAVTTLGKIASHSKGEVGLLGMAVARDFPASGHLFALFCPAERPDTMRVSRFTVADERLDPASERILLSWPYDTEHVFHMGGAMWMDGRGDLYIGNGDNCHWNPGLPVDTRPGRQSWDAFRSAANSRDYRGKILRIHPEPDGSYSVPEGNLFPGGSEGLPEIYAMGIRNPFRISVDDATGTLYIADVGPNVLPELGVSPAGYEEINATREAGNFGWPSFIGPNEPLPLYDFERGAEIARQDPQAPENPSPNNTGIRRLPPARPALVWYDNLPSRHFPTLGSGGRSIMAGPVYRHDPAHPSPVKFPEEFDGRLFIYEWMRNWIQTVRFDTTGPEIEPFQPDWHWRRPIDLKFGPDGALYLIEYGDKWWENTDSRITRVVYRRGNRFPVARLEADETAGKEPFAVHLRADASTDADGDALAFAWRINDLPTAEGPALRHTFASPGTYQVTLTVTDSHGAVATAAQTISVGNARPLVRFTRPAHGSFFDWETDIPYAVEVTDADSPAIDPALVTVQGRFQARRFVGEGEEFLDPGLALMRKSTCFACHLSAVASAGPPYEQVALRYAAQPGAADGLARKILGGGAGVWGEIPMPPHPQHTLDQARHMVDWILSLRDESGGAPRPGSTGTWPAPSRPAAGSRADEGVLILTAAYTDAGSGDAPPLPGETSIVLHSRRKKAALSDDRAGMAYVESVEGEKGLLGHLPSGARLVWRDLDLTPIRRVLVRAGSLGDRTGHLELRAGSPDGALLATVAVPPTGEGEFVELPADLSGGSTGLTDLHVVARFEAPEDQRIGLNWIEFRP